MKKFITLFFMSTLCINLNAQTPTDSIGLYAIHDGKATRIEKLTHSAIKGSGGLASMATFGMAKMKSKLEFKGETSNHQFVGTATLRVYFGKPSPQQITELYMFTPTNSIKNFEVARFQVKKGKRLLTGVSVSLLGSRVGVPSSDEVQVETKEIREGVFEIIIKGEPGEYCLMNNSNGTGGFGGVFDFTIK